MRVPIAWLHEYCRPQLDTAALADRLDLTGTKVERMEHHGVGSLEAFVVGRVVEAGAHPEADRLKVCRVEVGRGDVAQIVCGAPNVQAGQTVAVARPGARMADGSELGRARLRGVDSEGMILAEDELGIGPDHEGILVLGGDALEPGTPLAEVLPIATDVLELEVTPNRPDCLGVYGVAREAHAATGAPLGSPPWADDPGSEGSVEGAEVEVVATDLVPRFTARVFEEVRIGPSPPWLRARLTAAGQRPINNVVDITNYVMLAAGQPMHAFDLDQVAGARLVVRAARDGEQVQTLDGEIREMDAQTVVIDDADGPTSIAGIMGGARSEVSEGTTRVLMEAATWNGPNIKRSSIRLGLRSEASARFEKQLQPEQALEAQALAAKLMIELCGATLRPGTIDVGGPGPEPVTLHLREQRVAELLGEEIPAARCAEILHSLGFAVEAAADGVHATVPHWRRDDVYREVDLIEEVARIDGMEKLPSTLPSRPDAGGRLTAQQRARRRVEDLLAGHGLLEAAGWSFQGPEVADRLRLASDDRRRRTVRLRNPLSSEQSELRTQLLPSLLDVAQRNTARDVEELRLFETGAVYVADGEGELPEQPRHVAVVLAGPARAPTWRDPSPPAADFFAAKGVLAGLLDGLRLPWSVIPPYEAERLPEPFLHPGRCGYACLDEEVPVGWIGELHPLVTRSWELDAVAAFELDLDRLAERAGEVPRYREVPEYPAVRQDLAVVVDKDVAADRVLAVVRAAGGDLLERAHVFDVYRGEQVGAGKVSLAVALVFRAADRTLTEDEASERRQAIAAALGAELGGELRA